MLRSIYGDHDRYVKQWSRWGGCTSRATAPS
jgi:hypothetical protein